MQWSVPDLRCLHVHTDFHLTSHVVVACLTRRLYSGKERRAQRMPIKTAHSLMVVAAMAVVPWP
jgi:hypothetical protein